ncbi:Cof-type HAD-IIB family hydrolase [Rodentibacter caecimuris]|uniref:Hydrolase n=1 Tax=Rodentibacter caecimuris TaxID=1796644 RepID=A0ABX3KW25_9PAST|nr:hydrolase [Rodentibacter heylii]
MFLPNLRNNVKIVFFDIDETLFMKNEDHLPTTVLPALTRLKQNGIIPAIATGRALCSFPQKIHQLINQVGIDVFVTMNGQMVSVQGETVAKYPIPPAKIELLTHFFDHNQIDYGFVSPSRIAVSNVTPKVKSALDPITTNYIVDKDFYHHNDVFQLLPFYDESQDKLIQQANILSGLKVVRWHPDSVDLFDVEGSKARGISSAIQALGLKMENVMAFGDGLNDIEMLQTVEYGIAMGNAHPELKQYVKYTTDNIEQDGIANFLAKVGLI